MILLEMDIRKMNIWLNLVGWKSRLMINVSWDECLGIFFKNKVSYLNFIDVINFCFLIIKKMIHFIYTFMT